jgi:hypothetical protein
VNSALVSIMKDKGKERDLEEKALLTFLKRTKEGKYAPMAKGSLAHLREKAQREPLYDDEEYYYGIR